MAKTKISELEKTYGADRKEIIAFLNENGVDAKTANSSVDDDAVKLVAGHFGGAKAAVKAEAKPEPKTEAKPEGKAKAKAEAAAAPEKAVKTVKTVRPSVISVKKKPAEPASDPASPAAGPAKSTAAAEPAAAPAQAAAAVKKPVKKRKIIIVTGASKNKPNNFVAGYTKPQGQGTRPQQGRGAGARDHVAAPQTYHPIKPKTAPSQMDRYVEKPAETPLHTVKAVKAVKVSPAPVAPEAKTPAAGSPVPESAAAKAPETAPKLTSEKTASQKQPPEAKTPAAGTQTPARTENHPAAPAAKAPSAEKEPMRNGRVVGHIDLSAIRTPRPSRPQGQELTHDGRRIRTNDNVRGGGNAGGYRGGGAQGAHGGYRGAGGYNRAGQGGFNRAGQGGFNRGGNAGGAQGGGSSFGGNDRRRNNFRDRRNKKDVAFAEDEQREKRNYSGRFVRPSEQRTEAPEEQIKVITIPEKLTIGELADAMHMKPAEIIKKLFLAGKAMTVNSEVSYEEAENIAADYDILCEKEQKVDVIEELLKEDEDKPEDLVSRAPVICVMGHVDHGKTSILDYIRHSHVTAKEAGGITQAIGAYTVKTKSGRDITFLDTPGHEAFTAMRLRGAMSTDIAVLVVAADDGVMPQTIEAIDHAKAAGVEVIVAVNKIDKPDANPDRVKEQLSKYGLIPSDWGGQTEFVNVSAKTGQGIDDLLETILLTADVLELKANPDRLARGLVLEARLDKGRGPVANVLVQKGTLHVGDFVSAGPAFGRVRAMINDKGANVREAGPSIPVMVMGLSDVPSAGEVIVAHPTNDEAKSYAETYKAQHKEELVAENVMSMNVEDLFDQMREGKLKQLELIVKADVQGSVEALCTSLQKLSNDEVAVRIIHSAVGNITESDVTLAAASNAAIIGFNVHPDATAKSIADHSGVSIHLYRVIYQAIDDVDAALKGMLAPVYEEKVIGHAQIRQIFKSGKIGNIAGSMVTDGVIERDCSVRITRAGEKVFEGDLASLKRFKDDVKEVKAGFDCGLVFKDWDAMQVDDEIEAYKMVEVPREQVIAMKEKEAKEKAEAAKKADKA